MTNAILCLLMLVSFACSAQLDADTVYTQYWMFPNNAGFKKNLKITNSSSQPISLDSVAIYADTAYYKNPNYALAFTVDTALYEQPVSGETIRSKHNTFTINDGFKQIIISPQDSIFFTYFTIGICFCLTKNASEQKYGDTVHIQAVFYFSDDVDSVLIIGNLITEKISNPFTGVTLKSVPVLSNQSVLLNGKVSHKGRTPAALLFGCCPRRADLLK